MIAFFTIAAAMTIAAVLCVLAPLLRRTPTTRASGTARTLAVAVFRANLAEVERDVSAGLLAKEHRADARLELERQLVDDTRLQPAAAVPESGGRGAFWRAGIAALMLAVLPAAALGLYLQLGNPVAIPLLAGDGIGLADDHAMFESTPEIMVTRLAVRLEREPGNADGWVLLGRSYAVLARYDDAIAAYRRALALVPDQAQWLADLADIEATAAGGDLNGAARAHIEAALTADPGNPKALALAGSAAFDRRDYTAAIDYWQRLAALPQISEETAAQARANASVAQARLGASAKP
ncbi:c-type cytochrome biogenesis protein CcmI [Paraburkholderia dinghuensis]|uniref:C-type cytochrome biogenesis protein CcmI n=1 Tax=Paraburkholderia dinghuensis TaxID=2305225 RepID=A0A3N6PUW6_9BURK|nr:c-type cytochrome biogenesis protein CcmI [Paraburkholderia dinghuensis]RQH03636.1 c-type cytochrome biogenesis protein CcmI [Paraburkholderia dinghuensis]